MKKLPQDRPYVFRPPTPRVWLTPLVRWLNSVWFLKRVYRVSEIECTGTAAVASAVRAGDAVVLAPNHADHGDVHVLMEVLSRAGIFARYMGAREIFEVGPISAFGLQSAGVFSVNRDGADIAAVKMAMAILEEGEHPLVIYPEGEIYCHHEWLDPLHDGLAAILLRVAKRIPEGRAARVFPVAFRFQNDPAVEATFAPRLEKMEQHLGWKPHPELPVFERLMRVGAGALALKETEQFGDASSGTIPERLERFRERMLADLENRYGVRGKETPSVPDRVRGLRQRLRRALLDEENPPSADARRQLLDDLDRVHLAYQAYSYPGTYVAEQPSVNRIAETLSKLEEDLLGKPTFPVTRRVRVTFGEPIDASAMLRNGELQEKGGALQLTALLEDRLEELLRAKTP